MTSKELDRVISDTHKNLVDVEASTATIPPTELDEEEYREYVRQRELELGQLAQRHRDINIVSEEELEATRRRMGEVAAEARKAISIRDYKRHMDEWDKTMAYLRKRVIEAGITTDPRITQEVKKFVEQCRQLYLDQDKQPWLMLTPEERYQRKKKDWTSHKCSVHMRYGNWYTSPDKPGCAADNNTEIGRCIPECEYYPDTGRIGDDEVESWYL